MDAFGKFVVEEISPLGWSYFYPSLLSCSLLSLQKVSRGWRKLAHVSRLMGCRKQMSIGCHFGCRSYRCADHARKISTARPAGKPLSRCDGRCDEIR
ncbi:hypothetical protein KCP75_08350 [Salmonella enterica subsp. enterica]|nr:hypothetical protein KCP75_08350 [Salmonella enterica subsp. enterica]